MMSFLSAVVSAAQSIKILDTWIKKLFELYLEAQIKRVENQYNQRAAERRALTNALKRAETDEEIIAISRMLNNF